MGKLIRCDAGCGAETPESMHNWLHIEHSRGVVAFGEHSDWWVCSYDCLVRLGEHLR